MTIKNFGRASRLIRQLESVSNSAEVDAYRLHKRLGTIAVNGDLKKKYLKFPQKGKGLSLGEKWAIAIIGLMLFPFYWLGAYLFDTPGLKLRFKAMKLGLRLLRNPRDIALAYRLIVCPMDSFRYFEFDFIWRSIKNMRFSSYLDVSSPRLFPLLVVSENSQLTSNLLNPDKKDIQETRSLAKKLRLDGQCRFYQELIAKADLEESSFEVITSISVLEHIEDDLDAVKTMWSLLKPGGTLLLTVPCSNEAYEEYINTNDFGLVDADLNGFYFWQRFYDENLLRERVFSVTGIPRRSSIYGEKRSGEYDHNVFKKRTTRAYAFWKEPLMMGLKYHKVNQISELPGIGVIGMEFVKGGDLQHEEGLKSL